MEMNTIYYGKLADQLLEACQKADLVFVAKAAKVPERRNYRVFGVIGLTDTLGKADVYLQGQIDAQEDMLNQKWRQTKEIEV